MRIEGATQTYQGYSKPASVSKSGSFQQMIKTAAQDSYVPNAKAQTSVTEEVDPLIMSSYVSEGTRAKLIELARINKQADYTGMSYDEIYAEIWNRYNEAFEGNMIAINGLVAGPPEWSVISSKFEDELEEHIVEPEMALRKAMSGKTSYTPYENSKLSSEVYGDCVSPARLKVLGYEGMSINEIEAAIKEKYAGKNTTQDFLNMQSELHKTGVLFNKMGILGMRSYIRTITHQFVLANNPQYVNDIKNGGVYGMSPDQWNRVADQPFDIGGFASKMREMLSHMSFEGYPVNFKDVILSAIDKFIAGEK